jgi:hypothetical protein
MSEDLYDGVYSEYMTSDGICRLMEEMRKIGYKDLQYAKALSLSGL